MSLHIIPAESKLINKKTNKFFTIFKRSFDIVMSLSVLIATSPIMLTLMIMIKLDSKGPVFYLQERIGLNGKVFKVIKLRTMHTEVPEENLSVTTVDNDPRITKIGKLIRECSLDEFPQFINILKGDMSYIGPRPISVDEHNLVLRGLKATNKPIPQGLIPMVKPGITGWALLHGREKISYEDRFKLNAEYEDNIGFKFDFKVFSYTFKKYLFTNLCVISLIALFGGFAAYKVFFK